MKKTSPNKLPICGLITNPAVHFLASYSSLSFRWVEVKGNLFLRKSPAYRATSLEKINAIYIMVAYKFLLDKIKKKDTIFVPIF